MAMSDTGSSFANWSDDLYRYDPSLVGAADSTIVASTAAAATPASPASAGSGDGSPSRAAGGALGPRVAGKPAARKRARASRRAPVTLLNTDASNFRAMVQQFTGIPSGPYGPAGGGPVISFGPGGGGDYGLGGMPVRPSPTSAVMSFDHLGQHRPASALQQQQQHQSQLFRPQQQQYGDYGGMHGGGGDMSFLHGFESSSAEDRLLLQSIQAAQMLPRPAATNNTNGYNFG